MTKNSRIWNWFESDKVLEALNGSGDFFVPDVSFRESHDLLLVLRQLLLWAENGHLETATKGFSMYFWHLLVMGDLYTALDAYSCYRLLIEAGSTKLSINESELRQELVESINLQARNISNDDELRKKVVDFLREFPELKCQVGIT